jgi:hypothetical protein
MSIDLPREAAKGEGEAPSEPIPRFVAVRPYLIVDFSRENIKSEQLSVNR